MEKFETQGFDQTVSLTWLDSSGYWSTGNVLPDLLVGMTGYGILKVAKNSSLVQENDIERATHLDREHWDYCLEEMWRWIIAGKQAIITSKASAPRFHSWNLPWIAACKQCWKPSHAKRNFSLNKEAEWKGCDRSISTWQ